MTSKTEQREGEGRGHRTVDTRIVGKFRLGLKQYCAKLAWAEMEPWLQEKYKKEPDGDSPKLTQVEIAFNMRLSQGHVSNLAQGGMSFETLIAILTDADRKYDDVPLPQRRLRFIAGYQQAVTFVRKELLDREDDGESISPIDFLSVCSFGIELATDTALEIELLNAWTDESRMTIAERVREQAAKLIGIEIEKVPYETWDDFDRLRKKWGDEIIPCLQAIPKSWLGWHTEEDSHAQGH